MSEACSVTAVYSMCVCSSTSAGCTQSHTCGAGMIVSATCVARHAIDVLVWATDNPELFVYVCVSCKPVWLTICSFTWGGYFKVAGTCRYSILPLRTHTCKYAVSHFSYCVCCVCLFVCLSVCLSPCEGVATFPRCITLCT